MDQSDRPARLQVHSAGQIAEDLNAVALNEAHAFRVVAVAARVEQANPGGKPGIGQRVHNSRTLIDRRVLEGAAGKVQTSGARRCNEAAAALGLIIKRIQRGEAGLPLKVCVSELHVGAVVEVDQDFRRADHSTFIKLDGP
ncbi:hypothetical protein D3C77_288440 [compost metagenome]